MTWFIADEATVQSQELRDRVTDEGAIVPALWPIEIANALLFAVRGRRVNAAQRTRAFEALQQLPIEIDDETLRRVWLDTVALADSLRLTLYDACYLELAHRRRLPLATLDRELRSAARKLDVELI